MIMRSPATKKNRWLPKSTGRFPAKKTWHYPRRVALGTPLLVPQSLNVRTYGRAYADVRTKISHTNSSPDFLTHGALLVRFVR